MFLRLYGNLVRGSPNPRLAPGAVSFRTSRALLALRTTAPTASHMEPGWTPFSITFIRFYPHRVFPFPSLRRKLVSHSLRSFTRICKSYTRLWFVSAVLLASAHLHLSHSSTHLNTGLALRLGFSCPPFIPHLSITKHIFNEFSTALPGRGCLLECGISDNKDESPADIECRRWPPNVSRYASRFLEISPPRSASRPLPLIHRRLLQSSSWKPQLELDLASGHTSGCYRLRC